ncbi:hypothetical protein KXW30_006609 [Aspergillus fumigatus]|nr:hypothetical protein KXV35_006554 [Aspergillus fumigatus]KAH2352184.1 hypothetical protein KXW30_006609 [Aspergillus fumigatus]
MSMFSPMSPRIRATNLHPGPWIVDPKALAEGRMLADAVTIKALHADDEFLPPLSA